ncbi:MAG: filamentous hemagglutinin N-terminal domain-containing protein, partial [Okeania sp. SIO3B5]|uniref:two-partner secretion domain-containing protein n=1 Tax=Okeania sp. SIO3B5 TaxID=2607811 RepID=UPI001400BDE1
MKPTKLKFYTIITLTIILGKLATILPAYSQPITPANDVTGTTVNQNGNQFNIRGGTHNGSNLFHSFDQFNLNTNQTANFLTTPDTQNIFGRVTGGNTSTINGLIKVIGGNSNLFLINPAGIMFGPNASLNIPASFTVTTATGIGFNNNNFWFKAIGTNDYSQLVGNPSGYRFNQNNSAAIVNQGNLNLNPGENLTLLGGTVVNTGQLSTPGGNITIAAVEGSSTLRISQPGHLLSLEVNPKKVNEEDISQLTPLFLPNLLTGGDNKHATSIIVNADGNVVLTDNVTIANTSGDAIASGNIDVSNSDNMVGQVNIFGDRVALINANINADGLNSGGTVLIGGDFQGNGIVPSSQQTSVNQNSFISANAITNGDGGQVIVWSDGITNFDGNISAKGGENSGDGGFVEVSGKQGLNFNGQVNVSAEFGNTGTILLDPENIILGGSESNTSLENSEGNIILQADNDITINENIEIDSSVQLQAGRSININADINTSGGDGNINLFGNNDQINSVDRSDGPASINQLDGTTLNAGNGTINIQLGNLGEVGDINLANLTTRGQVLVNANGGNIARVSENSIINAGSGLFLTFDTGGIGLIDAPLQLNVSSLESVAGNSGVFFELLESVNIGGVSENVNGISTIAGGDLVLRSEGDVTATEDIFTDISGSELGGDINITAQNLLVTNGAQISASTFGNGDAGRVDITVENAVTFDGISSDGFASGVISGIGEGAAGNAGGVNITSSSLAVTNGAQISVINLGNGNVGGVDITANNIVFDGGTANSVSGAFSRVGAGAEGNAGGVNITSSSLEVINGAQISSSTLGQGNAGNINIATDSQLIIAENSEISAFTESTADGGNIIITSPETINFQGDGEVRVGSSGAGNPGNIITTIDTIPNQESPEMMESDSPGNENQSPNTPAPNTPDVISPNPPGNENEVPNTPAPNPPGNDNQSPNIPAPNTPAPNTPGNDNQSPNTPAPNPPGNDNQSPNIPAPITPGNENEVPNTPAPNLPSNNNQSPNIPTPNTPDVISPNIPSNNNQSPNIPTPNTPDVISPNIPSNNNQSPNIPTPNTPNVISPNIPSNNNQSPNIPTPNTPNV